MDGRVLVPRSNLQFGRRRFGCHRPTADGGAAELGSAASSSRQKDESWSSTCVLQGHSTCSSAVQVRDVDAGRTDHPKAHEQDFFLRTVTRIRGSRQDGKWRFPSHRVLLQKAHMMDIADMVKKRRLRLFGDLWRRPQSKMLKRQWQEVRRQQHTWIEQVKADIGREHVSMDDVRPRAGWERALEEAFMEDEPHASAPPNPNPNPIASWVARGGVLIVCGSSKRDCVHSRDRSFAWF